MENVISLPGIGERALVAEPTPEPSLPPRLQRVAIDRTSTIGRLAFSVMTEQHLAIIELEPLVRSGDVEAVHDARVAIRRLRAASSLFKDVIPQRAARLRKDLKWITRELGHVRDLDVVADQLRSWLETATPDEREAFADVEQVLAERRTKAHARGVRALDSRRYANLIVSLDAFLRRGPSARSRSANLPAVVVVPELVAQRYRSLRKAGKKLGGSSPAAELHAVRIRAKRFRYAMEFVRPLYLDPLKPMIRRVTRLQDVLGEIRDAEVAIEQLRHLGEGAGRRIPAEAVFMLGRLTEQRRIHAAALRRGFPGKLEAIEGKRWKQLKREMEHGRRAGAVPIAE